MPLANIPFPCAPFLLLLFSLRHESPEEARERAGGNQHIDLGGLQGLVGREKKVREERLGSHYSEINITNEKYP